MIEMANKRRLLSNEEVEWLAESYRKLEKDKVFNSLRKTFLQYINEFLDEELLMIKRLRSERDGR
jgi:hypothetical protein